MESAGSATQYFVNIYLHFLYSLDLLGSEEFVFVTTKPSLLIESTFPPISINLSSFISNGILISSIITSVFVIVKIGDSQFLPQTPMKASVFILISLITFSFGSSCLLQEDNAKRTIRVVNKKGF